MQKAYWQHPGKVIEDKGFKHLMSLNLNPKTEYSDGVLRCIKNRSGTLGVAGNVDTSQFYKVKEIKKFEKYKLIGRLRIKGEEELIKKIAVDDLKFIGFEDPDIVIEPDSQVTHLYFTIPIVNKPKGKYRVYLGHAEGKDLDHLKMTMPVLPPILNKKVYAKELSLAPINSKGVRLNIFESKIPSDIMWHSTIRVAKVKNLSKDWKLGKTILIPQKTGLTWIEGHASPGPLLPKSFIDVGKNKLVGILNGAEKNYKKNGRTMFGKFSVGLMIYNYEKGEIEWYSKNPLIKDTKSKIVTFASQFIQTGSNEGILYAHVDDSFVRAYTLYSDKLKLLLHRL